MRFAAPLEGPLTHALATAPRDELRLVLRMRRDARHLYGRAEDPSEMLALYDWTEEALCRSWRDHVESIGAPPPCAHCGRLMLAGRCCSEAA